MEINQKNVRSKVSSVSKEPVNQKSVDTESKVDKYITDIKELPPTSKDEPPKVDKKIPEAKAEKAPDVPKATPGEIKKTEDVVISEEKPADEKQDSIFTFKDIILAIINFVSIILLIILLVKLPQKAKEYQDARVEEIQNQSNPDLEYANIESDKSKSDKLNALFLDETGIVNFVGEVEKLKSESGAIQKITFASQKAVKDQTGLYGIPVVIELKGSWQAIGGDLEKIQSLQFLFRPVSIDAGPAKDAPGVLIFNYGGLLYVNDKEVSK